MANAKNLNVNINRKKVVKHGGGAGGFYFLGMIGAAVYYVQNANGFGSVVVALLKSLVWPAFLIHDLLKFIYS